VRGGDVVWVVSAPHGCAQFQGHENASLFQRGITSCCVMDDMLEDFGFFECPNIMPSLVAVPSG
jgi:hypothetical protein